jgi:uncharacterized protein (DUF433 family)
MELDRHSGDECFAGTRVPVRTLWECLRAGEPLERFLEAFPSVERWQAEVVIRSRTHRRAHARRHHRRPHSCWVLTGGGAASGGGRRAPGPVGRDCGGDRRGPAERCPPGAGRHGPPGVARGRSGAAGPPPDPRTPEESVPLLSLREGLLTSVLRLASGHVQRRHVRARPGAALGVRSSGSREARAHDPPRLRGLRDNHVEVMAPGYHAGAIRQRHVL